MKISLKEFKFEFNTVVVINADVERTRNYYTKRGWTVVGEAQRADGKTELSFKRKSGGNLEIEP